MGTVIEFHHSRILRGRQFWNMNHDTCSQWSRCPPDAPPLRSAHPEENTENTKEFTKKVLEGCVVLAIKDITWQQVYASGFPGKQQKRTDKLNHQVRQGREGYTFCFITLSPNHGERSRAHRFVVSRVRGPTSSSPSLTFPQVIQAKTTISWRYGELCMLLSSPLPPVQATGGRGCERKGLT